MHILLSFEDFKDMRNHLLSSQKDFLFIFSEGNNIELLGKFSFSTKITPINQYLLRNNNSLFDDSKTRKNYAFS